MKKTILCALAALAVSSCGEIPTEVVPADAVPVEGETLAGTDDGMQAAADGGNAVCEVEYDDDLTSETDGSLTVTVPGRVWGWSPYMVSFAAVSYTRGTPDELGVYALGCQYPFISIHQGKFRYCYILAGIRSNAPWRYDSATGTSSSTLPYRRLNTNVVTEISFVRAAGRCNFRGLVRT